MNIVELSGVEVRYIVSQIASKAANTGYYVSAINSITRSSILLRLHHPTQEDIILVLSVRGIWTTKLKFKQIEETSSSLESSLRGEIERAKLESIEQAGSERIVILTFRQLDGRARKIIVEFFGDGNLLVCDENLQILSILNSIEVRHRTLAVGLRYALPPSKGTDVFQLTLEQLKSLKKEAKNLDILRWIGRSTSMPKKFVEEAAFRAGLDHTKKVEDLTADEIARIYEVVTDLVTDISTGRNHEPIVIMQESGGSSKPVDALPIITQAAAKLPFTRVDTFMEAVDSVLSTEILDLGRSSKTVELDKQIAVLEHDLDEQNKAKDAVNAKAEQIRKLAGELMTLSYMQGNSESDDGNFQQVLSAHLARTVSEKGVEYIEISDQQVPLQQNLAKTASLLFARAKELERGSASIDEARAKISEQIAKLRSKTSAIHKKVIVQKQSSKEWYERYRWFVTTEGYLAIGGRDASSNSALVRKHLTEDDIVFHAEVHGSPFFIVKNAAGQAAAEQISASLNEVAQATVGFSRAWKDGLTSADAYWVSPDQIKKGAPTGQFLPKGSFVIEGKRNYLKGVEIRLAIGIVATADRYALVCGPQSAVKARSIYYAVLQQGGMDPMSAAKKAKAELVALASHEKKLGADAAGEASAPEDLADIIKQISLDDFVRTLPTGQSRISFAARGQGLTPKDMEDQVSQPDSTKSN